MSSSYSGSAPGLPIGLVSSLVGDPTNARRFYAAAYFSNATNGVGIYRTEDAGTTWSRVSNSAIDALLDTSNNIQLAINARGTLFAGIVDRSQLAGFFRTQDHGATFTDFGLPTTIEGNPPVVVGIHPYEGGDLKLSILADTINDDVAFVGGDAQPYPPRIYNGTIPNSIGANFVTGRLFRSTAPGTWVPLTHSGTADNSAPHGDSRDMAFDLSGNIIEVNDGGVYRRSAPTTNNGTWTSAGGAGATSIRVTEIHSIAYDNHGSVIMAGTQDNGTITQAFAGDITWPQIGPGDGGKVAVFDASRTGNSFDYYGGTYLSGFRYDEFTPAGSPVGNTVASALLVDGSGKTLTHDPGSRFDANIVFYTPFTVNEDSGPHRRLLARTSGRAEPQEGHSRSSAL